MVGEADETIQRIVSNDERPEPKRRAGLCNRRFAAVTYFSRSGRRSAVSFSACPWRQASIAA